MQPFVRPRARLKASGAPASVTATKRYFAEQNFVISFGFALAPKQRTDKNAGVVTLHNVTLHFRVMSHMFANKYIIQSKRTKLARLELLSMFTGDQVIIDSKSTGVKYLHKNMEAK